MPKHNSRSLVLLMIEHEQPEGLSARKLVVETAKHNVLTAYNPKDGLELYQRFPNVDAVLIHGMLQNCESLIGEVLKHNNEMPVIVATPTDHRTYKGARYVVNSREPAKLLDLLAQEFNASVTSD